MSAAEFKTSEQKYLAILVAGRDESWRVWRRKEMSCRL